jgi:SAM-dependent methyltransferase
MGTDEWQVGDAYEAYVGRWSRRVATRFLDWLDVPAGRRWLDVGCGTGALAHAILATAGPERVTGVDPSAGFLAAAAVDDPRVEFRVGDARDLPVPDADADVVVSGLALNFVPEPERAVAEFGRVVRPGGTAAAYVWDYAEGMAMMRLFWDAAAAFDPAVAALDEGDRFPLCRPEPLRALWSGAFRDVAVVPIEIPTEFRDFDDFWAPFLGGQGPAPGYLASLPPADRDALRDRVRAGLPATGPIALTARAWAVRGTA